MKINKEMVEELNKRLSNMNSSLRFKICEDVTYSPTIQLTVSDTAGFIEVANVYGTKKFYEFIERFFFENYGITLGYNNIKNICWSNDFS